ncbi:hypothetical protein SNE26_28230 [Mucilaginibacter sp. cycad4]|uniref:hypothetical protein n=1 Tax=Mucilaginibacter sp. cycad4 TaxID=3342096 RepID=UPI002AAB2AF8|nr:hypothetical protein [Mucilaginibacter gossypii]WPU99901.1 hypothetical protein SNE26_28230 [Mucilaginibacter gossypii]
MKKSILTLLTSIIFNCSLHAQWTTSGSVTTTPNTVGIGTTSTPDEKLVVNGSIKSILDPNPSFQSLNVVHIIPLGVSGITGAQNWTIRGVYQYPNGVGLNATGGDLDIIKSLNGNTILGTRGDGTVLGNVGIGTQTPNTRLDVNGVISMNSFGYLSCLRLPANNYTNLFLGGAIKDNSDGTYNVRGDGGSNYFSAIKMDNGGNNGAAINFYNGAATGGSSYNITNSDLSNYLQMRIAGGNVSIGTADSKGYKLAVNGSAIATSMTVKLNSAWPDYVFTKDYTLPSLGEVKTYIDQYQHLPEIPSAREIAKDGQNLGEMNRLLLKKVEELTLYLIALKTEVSQLQKQINSSAKSN